MSMGVAVSKGKGGRRRPTPEINVTPLVDVMLVLLVIFMITIQAARESIPMELPQASGDPIKSEKAQMEVSIDQYSHVHAPGNRLLDMADVPTEIPRLVKGHEKDEWILSAHRKLPYETLVKVIAALRTGGVETINITVEGGSDSGTPAK